MADELMALYTRVSLRDLSQDPMNQSVPLRNLAKALGGQVVEEYTDYGSGGNGDRKNFLRMLEDAEKRKFKVLLVWSLDRFSREGISNCLGYLERLRRNGVAVKSLTETSEASSIRAVKDRFRISVSQAPLAAAWKSM